MSIKITEAGLSIIKQYENLELNAYPDPGTKAEPITIGYGTTVYASGKKVRMGDTVTKEQAEYELQHHVDNEICSKLDDILSQVGTKLSQNSIDAIISLVYNIGITAFAGSTLLKKLVAGDLQNAAEEFKRWNRSKNKVLDGLTKRRYTEYMLFLEQKPVASVIIDPNKEFVSFVYEETGGGIVDTAGASDSISIVFDNVKEESTDEITFVADQQTQQLIEDATQFIATPTEEVKPEQNNEPQDIQTQQEFVEPLPRPGPSRPTWKLW